MKMAKNMDGEAESGGSSMKTGKNVDGDTSHPGKWPKIWRVEMKGMDEDV